MQMTSIMWLHYKLILLAISVTWHRIYNEARDTINLVTLNTKNDVQHYIVLAMHTFVKEKIKPTIKVPRDL